jgi:hypothetical protein
MEGRANSREEIGRVLENLAYRDAERAVERVDTQALALVEVHLPELDVDTASGRVVSCAIQHRRRVVHRRHLEASRRERDRVLPRPTTQVEDGTTGASLEVSEPTASSICTSTAASLRM